jgi:hypothetical protein
MKTAGLQIEAYFTHLKRQRRIGDDVGDLKYSFTKSDILLGLKYYLKP